MLPLVPAAGGSIATVTFGRDPLSEQYDAAAGRIVGRARRTPGHWVYVTVPRPPSYTGIGQWLAAHGVELAARDGGGLTAWERAYQRAVYWVFNGGSATPDDAWSLQRAWGPHVAGGRQFGIRVSRKDVARRAVKRMPVTRRYTENPAIRSGGEGSTQQRF